MNAFARCVLAAAVVSSACRPAPPAPDERESAGASSAKAPAAPAPPVDHLAPGELVEGGQRAFGLALPRITVVKGIFVDVAYTRAPASVHALAEYFRARLEGGSFREGSSAASFDGVTVRGGGRRPLALRITADGDGANVEIRDATPPVLPDLPDEAARWRHAGLTPDGRLADPQHLD